MIFEHTTYRDFLKETLAKRQAQNKRYSLRAMARQLGLAPSMLSDLLKGQRQLSLMKGADVAQRLGLGAREGEYFLLMIQREAEKVVELQAVWEERLLALNPSRQVRDVGVDAFRLIADWHHLAVLESVGLTGFEFTPANLARRLGITTVQAECSIALLQRLELIERDTKGGCRKTHLNILAQSPAPNQGLRRFHKQMLEKAIESVEGQTPQEKFIGSETFCFDDDQLGDLQKLANEFLDKAVALAQKSKKRDHVRHLGVQFFKLTNDHSKENI